MYFGELLVPNMHVRSVKEQNRLVIKRSLPAHHSFSHSLQHSHTHTFSESMALIIPHLNLLSRPLYWLTLRLFMRFSGSVSSSTIPFKLIQ